MQRTIDIAIPSVRPFVCVTLQYCIKMAKRMRWSKLFHSRIVGVYKGVTSETVHDSYNSGPSKNRMPWRYIFISLVT